MTFDLSERGVAISEPVELYKFTGTYNTYRMTSSDNDLTNLEGFYESTGIKRSKLENSNQEESNLSLNLEIPFNNPMILEYAFQTSPPSLFLELRRAHRNDLDDNIIIWNGEVLSWTIEGRIAKLKIPALFTYEFDKLVPPIKYQAPCNHILGDSRCKIDLSLPINSKLDSVSSISGNTIVVNSSPFIDGDCIGGEMFTSTERRMIISNTGTSFVIALPFASLSVSDPITFTRGCDHSIAGDCLNKFSNTINFGGFPLVPSKNPFGGRL